MTQTLVIIPAFNEETTIAEVIAPIHRMVPEAKVLVINDGSGDRTARAAAAAGAVVVSHPFNLGYGATIQTGYKYACAQQYEYLVQIDGDGQHDPAFIPRLLEPIMSGEIDVALGSRFLHPESYRPPFFRKLGMRLFQYLASQITGFVITDSTSGYQAFNRRVLHFLATDIFPQDYPDADMLISLHLAGFRIRELPVRMLANPSQKSMHAGVKPLYYVFKMLLSIGVNMLRKHTEAQVW